MHFHPENMRGRLHDHLHNPSRGRGYRIFTHIAFGLVLAVSLALIFGGIVMWLWNGILPELLSVRAITYWQSVGLLVLSRILFGGFGRGGHRGRPHGHREAWREYEAWWHEVGQQSFQEYAANKPNRQ